MFLENNMSENNTQIFGRVSKLAMCDENLSCTAKTLYAAISSYAADKNTAYPTRKTLGKSLNIGKDRLNSAMTELTANGYITVEQSKQSCGKFSHNIYNIVACPEKYNVVPDNPQRTDLYNKIQEFGIQNYSYGIVSQSVMTEPTLDIISKVIYAYIAAFAGNTNSAFPSVEMIIRNLKICQSTYQKYIKQLVATKFIKIIPHKNDKGQFVKNEYILLNHPNSDKPSAIEPQAAQLPSMNPHTENPPAVEPHTADDAPNKNNIKTNSFFNTNNSKKNKIKTNSVINQSGLGAKNVILREKNITATPETVRNELAENQGIPAEYALDKLKTEIAVKFLSESVQPKVSPENRSLILYCITAMLSKNYKKYAMFREKLNKRIIVSDEQAKFDKWILEFEDCYFDYISIPHHRENIRNLVAHTMEAVCKFVYEYDFVKQWEKPGENERKSSFDIDDVWEKVINKSMRFDYETCEIEKEIYESEDETA
ncbi:MAG: helix-turn-helix domain-containing protein [Oscillospiraceae bacterium]|nr:helix-turn-helix domain-containing protein [Oscillospiraceae bacterium]